MLSGPRKAGQPNRSGILVLRALRLILLLSVTFSIGVSWFLVHPIRHAVSETPADYGLSYQEVTFRSRDDGLKLKGWFLPSPNSHQTVVVAHGYRNNRSQDDVPALSLAKDIVSAGYNVLMFDFRNCGQSEGNKTSFGQYEVRDLLGAIDFVRQSPVIFQSIAVLGFSMGASTAILASVKEPAIDAVIADSPFSDLGLLLNSKLGPFCHLIRREVELLSGLNPWRVSTVKALESIVAKPLFIIHGNADQVIPVSHREEVFRVAGPNASLWIVPGAEHLKAYEAAGDTYSTRVIEFLDLYLNPR
jgi:dipeptidyl aminopeptidase/acylaminoacyl peptidase